MIAKLKLSAFKCFAENEFLFSKLNLLAGVNGSGKSSVLQSLLCLRQSFETGQLGENILALNGRLIEIGSAKDAFCQNSSADSLGIQLSATNADPIYIANAPYTPAIVNHYNLALENTELNVPSSSLNLFSPAFNYLTAERLGPRKISPVLPERRNSYDVGKMGEHALFVVASEIKEAHLYNDLVLLENSEGDTLPFFKFQWLAWMQSIFPGFDAETVIDYASDYVRTAYALDQVVGSERGAFVKPINTAFGVSYILGIIVAGLIAPKNSVLIVENPEAHLHPSAQSRIGEFLARVAHGDVQVFVETHSEHVMNGMRRVVKQGLLSPQDFAVYYFARSISKPPVTELITINSSAEFSRWPVGFFDQLDKDLQALYPS